MVFLRSAAGLGGLALVAACSSSGGSTAGSEDDLRAPSHAVDVQTIAFATVAKASLLPKGPPAEGKYRVHMIDVGTGLAVLVQGHDFNMLFDGGSNDDQRGIAADGNKSRLLAYLFATVGPSGPKECIPEGDSWPTGVDAPRLKLNHVFLSHPHNDHASMLDDVLRCYQAEEIWDSGAPVETLVYRSFVQSFADDASIKYHTASAPPASKKTTIHDAPIEVHGSWDKFTDGKGDIPLGAGATFKILHGDGAAYSDANRNSIVLSVRLGGKKVLLLGDAESGSRDDPTAPVGEVEQYLLQAYPDELKADVMQVGHHGSKNATRLEFLKAVDPAFALLSTGPTKYSGVQLPDPEVVSAIEGLKAGIKLLRTDTNDAKCPEADRVGMDDATPGGCDNLVLDL